MRRAHFHRPELEALEVRLAPTCSAGIVQTFAGDELRASCDSPGNTITLDHSGSNTLVNINGSNWSFNDGLFDFTDVEPSGGSATVNILRTSAYSNLEVFGLGGSVTVNLGVGGTVGEVRGLVSITNQSSHNTTVNVNDYLDSSGRVVRVTTSAPWEQITGLAPATIQLFTGDIAVANVYTGTAGATVNVLNTSVYTYLTGNGPGTVVNVGNSGSVQGLLGNLAIYNASSQASATTVTVDDSSDTVARTVYQDTNSNPGFGQITGLAPSAIFYWYNSVAGVTLDTGKGATVNVLNTVKPVTLIGYGISTGTTVNLGNSTNGVQGIVGTVTVQNAQYFTTLNINDAADAGNRVMTLSAPGTTGTISGLAPGNINFNVRDLTALNITGGRGANTYNVTGTAALNATTLNTGPGNDTVNVESTAVGRPLTISEGSAPVAVNIAPTGRDLHTIQGPVTINGGSGTSTLSVYDSNSTASTGYTLTATSLAASASGGATITFDSGTRIVALFGSRNGGDSYTVTGTGAPVGTQINPAGGGGTVTIEGTNAGRPLTINEGAAPVAVSVSPTARDLHAVLGSVTIVPDTDAATLSVYDSNSTASTGYTLTATSLAASSSGGATITFGSRTRTVALFGSRNGGDSYTVTGTGAPAGTQINPAGGGGTVTIEGTNAGRPLTINEGAAPVAVSVSPTARDLHAVLGSVTIVPDTDAATLSVYDSNSTASTGYTLTATSLAASSSGGATITFGSRTRTVALFGSHNGGDSYTVTGTGAPVGTQINPAGGGGTVTIEGTNAGRPLTINEGAAPVAVSVSPTARSLANIAGAVTIVPDTDAATLSVDDSNNTASTGYSLTATSLASSSGATITFGSRMRAVTFNGGRGNNTYTVSGTPASASMTLNPGSGSDPVDVWATQGPLTINGSTGALVTRISPNSLTLDTIQGAVTITGGSAASTLVFNDQATTHQVAYTLAATSLARTGAANINFPSGMSAVTLDSGGAASGPSTTLTVTGTGAVNGTTVNTGRDENLAVDVWATQGPLTFGANGTVVTRISPNSLTLDTIQGAVTITGGSAASTLVFNDQATTHQVSYTLAATSLARTGAATVNFPSQMSALTLNGGGNGTDTYTVSATATATTLNLGNGSSTVNVENTAATKPLTVNEGSGPAAVSISPTARNLDTIQGAVTVTRAPNTGFGGLVVYDQNKTTGQTYTLTGTAVSRTGSAGVITYSSPMGLTVNASNATNTYTVSGTGAQTGTTLNLGGGDFAANVENTTTPLTINEGSGLGTVNISPTARNLDTIQGAVTITRAPNTGFGGLVVYDQNKTTGQTYTLAATAMSRTGSLGVITYSSPMSVTVNASDATNIYTVTGSGAERGTTLNLGAGDSSVNVENTTKPLTVNLGSGNDTVNVSPTAHDLSNLQGALTVNGNSGYDILIVNDQGYAANTTYTLTATTLARPGAAIITIGGQLMNEITLNGGSGADTYNVGDTADAYVITTLNSGGGGNFYNVEGTTFPLTVNLGTGNDDVLVSPTADNLSNLQGALTVDGNSGYDILTVNDQAYVADTTYNLTATTLSRSGAATITIGGQLMDEITLNGGSGANTYNVTGTGGLNLTTLTIGAGIDTVNVGVTTHPLVVNGNGGGGNDVVNFGNSDTVTGISAGVTLNNASSFQVNVNDSADATDLSFVVISSGGITGMAPAALNFSAASVTLLTINGGSGNSNYFFQATPASQGVTLTTGLGGNFVNVGASTAPVALNTGLNDVIYVSNTGGTLDGIAAVAITDATGTSQVTLEDGNYGGGDDYLVTNSTVTLGRSATFFLSYSGLGSLALGGGAAGSTFDIDSTSVATLINAGPGGNIFHISPFSQYLAASILGPSLTLNGGGGDTLEFFDAADPNAETFNFDSAPTSLTLGSTGTDITDFYGMGGGVYVVTNGFSTPDDQSGAVIFDPSGGPPSGQGNGLSAGSGRAQSLFAEGHVAQATEVTAASTERLGAGEVSRAIRAMASALLGRAAGEAIDPTGLIDQLFSS